MTNLTGELQSFLHFLFAVSRLPLHFNRPFSQTRGHIGNMFRLLVSESPSRGRTRIGALKGRIGATRDMPNPPPANPQSRSRSLSKFPAIRSNCPGRLCLCDALFHTTYGWPRKAEPYVTMQLDLAPPHLSLLHPGWSGGRTWFERCCLASFEKVDSL